MARKIKFALEMADGSFVSNLEGLQKHIKNNDDVKKLVEYYLDGRLEKWLLDRYYDEEAKKLQLVDKDDPDFTCKLCKAIDADYTPSEPVNIALIEYEKKMRKALEDVISDSKIIENAGSTVSNQSDLDFLIKNGKQTIYLWGDSFKLFVVKNISYIGILGKPSVDIGLPDLEAVESYGIKLENVKLPESILRAEEEKRRTEEEARRRAEEEARRRAEEEVRRIVGEEIYIFEPIDDLPIYEEAIIDDFNPFKNANVGDVVKFGNYPQTSNGQNQPIEWQVLSKKNNRMLVISRYGLDAKRFDSSSTNWWNSEIRNWLNGDFYNKAFTDQEKKSINLSNLSDVGTSDNVFFLSYDEAKKKKYFANDEARKCKATEYAVKNSAYVSGNGYSSWWLRSRYLGIYYGVYSVDIDGDIHISYSYVSGSNRNLLVRPALWINL